VSGGSNSMALLNLMHNSLLGDSSRKMFFKCHVVYIDESHVYNWSEEERERNYEMIRRTCESLGFPWTILPLENVYSQDEIEESKWEIDNVIVKSIGDVERLKSLISLASPLCSNKEDLIHYLKKRLLLKFAQRFNFKKLFLGCSALTVATKTMSEISKGRGKSLPHLVSYIDDRYPDDIKFMNPIKDFLQKEIAFYNKINSVPCIEQKNLCLQAENKKGKVLPGFGNLDFLCEEFIQHLNHENEQTVHTVLRTTTKLMKQESDFMH
jgi:cytoplasmic tRNA 2-thiolation protein 2